MSRPRLPHLRSIAAGGALGALMGFGLWVATRYDPTPLVVDGGFDHAGLGSAPAGEPAGRQDVGSALERPEFPIVRRIDLFREHAAHAPKVLVRGLVVREGTGEPIAGGRITVLSLAATSPGGPPCLHDAEHPRTLDGVRVIELTSRNDGSFEWDGPSTPPTRGEFAFGARAPGFGARCGPFPAIDAVHPMARIELRPEGIVRGRVSRESGRPIPGTRVDVRCGLGHEDDAWWREQQALATRTGADGAYELREIDAEPGGWTTSIDFRSFTGVVAQSASVPVALASGETREVDWTPVEAEGKPRRVSTLTGHVREREGTPIAGAMLRFRQRVTYRYGSRPGSRDGGVTYRDIVSVSARSDSAGMFTLRSSDESVASETFLIQVAAAGFVAVSLRYRGDERGPLEFALEPARPQEGVVTGSDGTPARGVWVAFFSTDRRVEPELTGRPPEPVEQVITDREGRFRARALGDGPHDVVVNGDFRVQSVARQPLLRIVLPSTDADDADR